MAEPFLPPPALERKSLRHEMSQPYTPFPKAQTKVQLKQLSISQDSPLYPQIFQVRWEGAVEINCYFKYFPFFEAAYSIALY